MRPPISRPYGHLLFLTLALGCGAGWHQPEAVTPGPLPERQQVQVWQHGTALRWHAVRVTADSISGIVYLRPTSCDSCRLAVPRASVDSLRLGNPVAGFWKSFGLVYLALGIISCAAFCNMSAN